MLKLLPAGFLHLPLKHLLLATVGDRMLTQVKYQTPCSAPASDTPPPAPGTNFAMQSMPEAAKKAAWGHICQPYTSPALGSSPSDSCSTSTAHVQCWSDVQGMGVRTGRTVSLLLLLSLLSHSHYSQVNGEDKRAVPIAKWILCQEDPLLALLM